MALAAVVAVVPCGHGLVIAAVELLAVESLAVAVEQLAVAVEVLVVAVEQLVVVAWLAVGATAPVVAIEGPWRHVLASRSREPDLGMASSVAKELLLDMALL